MKKLLSVLLVIALVVGMAPAVFAADVPTVTVTADKNAIKAGESITLTITIDKAIENLMNFEFAIFFDANAYTKTGSTIGDAYKNQPGGSTVVGEKVDIRGENALRVSGLSTLGDPLTLEAGMIATVTFTATENITADNASFKITTEAMNDYDTIGMIAGGVNLVGASIPVTVKSSDEVAVEVTPAVSDGKATASVDADTKILTDKPVTITATGTVKDTAVTVPAAVADKLNDASQLTLNTAAGTLTFDSAALDAISENSDITIRMAAETQVDSEILVTLTAVNAAGENVFTAGSVAVVIPVPAPAEGNQYKVYYKNGTKLEPVASSYADGKISMTLTHFSEYVIKEEAPVTGYNVTMAADKTASVGETVSIPVTVGHDGTVTTYNAFDMSFSYDASKLELTSTTIEGMTVTTGNGTVHVQGYGANRAVGTAPFTLTFTVKTPGTSDVKVTVAKVDISANAITADAPDATLADDTTTVTVSTYTVNLSADFTGDATAAPGADYTFTAKDTHYNYDFTGSTMGGTVVNVVDNGDGTFTVQNVSGNIVIASNKTAKTYTVSVTGTGSADVTAAATATYLTDYTFTLTKAEAYNYDLTVTVGGTAVTPTLSDSTYTIAGANVTGNISITVSKTAKPVTTTQITFQGAGSGDVAGGTTQTAQNGQDFQFELNEDAGFDYVVKLDGVELRPNADGKYTIPADKITGAALNLTIEKTAKQTITVETTAYIQLDGKTMWLVTAEGTVSANKVLSYDGTAMFWSEKYDAYCFLVISDKDADAVKTEAEGKISEADANKADIAYDCDVNKTGLVDINDAQLSWDMYNAEYDSFDAVSMEKFLNADVNGDKTVNVSDATAIIAAIQ